MITKIAKYYRASYLQDRLLKDQVYPWNSITLEGRELVDAIKNRDMANVKEEIQDVLYNTQMVLHQRTGVDFPVVGASDSINKFLNRLDVWEKLFKDKNKPFSTDYMRGGSNYRKPSKIRGAFERAGIKVTDDDLRRWEPIVGGYEQPI